MTKHVLVGAVIHDGSGRLFFQKRSATRRLFPRCWDVVGGHVEGTESLEDALKREVFEETSWAVIRLGDQVLEAKWTTQGGDGPVEWEEHIFFVDVEGDLSNPTLESGKVETCGWFREEDCGVLMENREPEDDHVFRIAKTAFARLREALNKPPFC